MARDPKGLKGLLISYLQQQKDWTHKGTIQELVWKNPKNSTRYIPDNVGTCLRWLERNHFIAVKDDKESKSVLYKYLPSWPDERRKYYIPTSQRPEGEEHILFRDPPVVLKEEIVSEEEQQSFFSTNFSTNQT
jgi:hypothetical protein